MRRTDSHLLLWLLPATILVAIFCAGVLAAPWMGNRDWTLGAWSHLFYGQACHQMPDRCLDLGFGPLAVCARCSGLYLGALLGMVVTLMARRSIQPTLRWLIVVSLPTLIDFSASLVGLPSLPNWPRFWIAAPLGLLLGLAIADAIVDLGFRSRAPADRQPNDPLQ
jgi:uncharacterized membrane protein